MCAAIANLLALFTQRNTFQCVLAVVGTETYAIYLYADGMIEWTTGEGGINGLGGNPAIVGYNAGDGNISYTVPGSQAADIINITSVSNVDEPGVWVFRLEEDDVVLHPCDTFQGILKSGQTFVK